ncbi:MAG: hypothetical protein ACSLE0_07410 [Chitinophagaceae bacterium]
MSVKKFKGILAMLCITIFPSVLIAQNDPQLLVVARFHFNLSSPSTFDEWKAHEKEYFDKVTAKNDLIVGANVLVHYYTDDNSEVLVVSVYRSWEDIEKANVKDNELIRAAWPDSVKRSAFFDKRRSFYTSVHSDEIRSIAPNTKVFPADTASHIYYVRTTHRAFPEDGKPGEYQQLKNEFDQNVTMKNSLIKGYYPSRHLWGADSREFVEAFVYSTIGDLEKSVEASQALVKSHWPDETKRKEFFNKLNKYSDNWHGDALYRNVPVLRK